MGAVHVDEDGRGDGPYGGHSDCRNVGQHDGHIDGQNDCFMMMVNRMAPMMVIVMAMVLRDTTNSPKKQRFTYAYDDVDVDFSQPYNT